MSTGAPPAQRSQTISSADALSPEEQTALQDLFTGWERLARQHDLLPPMSPLASRLLSLDINESLANVELAKIVESDPVLTARILGLANAAAVKRTAKPIYEVMAAVVRLGTQSVFEAAFAQLAALWLRAGASLPDRSQLSDLWLEYLLTAFCSRELATAVGDADVTAPIAYAGGLLHDVGTLALSCAQPKLMSRFVRSGYGIGTALGAGFVTAHCCLSEALLKRWGTPAVLAKVAAGHHDGIRPQKSMATAIVCVADHLHRLVLAHPRSDFQHKVSSRLGCFEPAVDAIEGALTQLDLAGELEAIVARVAAEGRRIEMLAAAVST